MFWKNLMFRKTTNNQKELHTIKKYLGEIFIDHTIFNFFVLINIF